MRGDRGITAEDRLRVALANLRNAGFSDDVFLQLECALTPAHEAVGTPRESFGRLTLDAARSEKQVLAAALVPEAGRGLFGRDNEDRFWAVGRIDIGAGPWPRLGILFPADYPETCPLVFVFATSGGAVRLPLDLEATWDPRGGCRLVLQQAVAFLRSLVAQPRLGR